MSMLQSAHARRGEGSPVVLDAAEPRLDGVTFAGIAFQEAVFRGRPCLEAHGVDCEGRSRLLARRYGGPGRAGGWVTLFSTLLARGLRAEAQILVDAAGCSALRRHVLAAWGTGRVVFVPDPPGEPAWSVGQLV